VLGNKLFKWRAAFEEGMDTVFSVSHFQFLILSSSFIEDADARPPHLKGVRALGLLSVSAGFWLDSGWTLQLLPRRRQDPSIQKASQADGKKRPKMKPNIGENRSKMSQNRSEIEQK
jgi:hypothetical protein